MLSVKVKLLPSALSELLACASHSGYLTLADRYGLMAALLDEQLGDKEKSAIDQLLIAVRQGRICVVNELSVVL